RDVAVGPQLVAGRGSPSLPRRQHVTGRAPRPGQEEPGEVPYGVDPERERGHDAEVAAAAAPARPEEVRVVSFVAGEDLAGGRDDADRPEAVAREAELPAEHALAAAERQAGAPDGRAR